MKRVLMVARFYPPWGGGGVYRTLGFARHLREFGYEPVILTGPGTGAWIRDEGLLEGVRDVEVVRAGGAGLSGVGVIRAKRTALGSFLASLAPWLLIPDGYRSWIGPAVKAGLKRLAAEDGFHAIYSTSPPDSGHLVAREIRRATGLPWIADFRDPWIGLGYREPPTPWHRAAHGRLLHRVLAEASHVIAATEGTGAWLALADPSLRERSSVIPNGYEVEDWVGIVPHRFDRFTVLHAGRLSGDRDLKGFLGGFRKFLDQDPTRRARAQLVLIGPHDDGPVRQAREQGLEDVVHIAGQVPHREAMEMEAGADLLLLIKHREPSFRELIPGKLYEYFGAQRPILAVAGESPAAELVRGLRAGWVAPPDSPGRVAMALEEAFAGRSPKARAEDCAEFTRAALTGRLARILDSLS